MKKGEMDFIAEKMEEVLLKRRDPAEVRKEVATFMASYQEVKYCFDGLNAYRLLEFLERLRP